MKPLISIITPCFNSEKTLEECILSIKNKSSDIEHIIIDGGSTDDTLNIIKKYSNTYNLRWISEKDNGITDAMNKGFNMASGTFCSWIDADNYYNPDIFNKVIDKINSHPEVDIIYGNIFMVSDGKLIKKYIPQNPISFENVLIKNTGGVPLQPGNFFKLELFKKVNGFNLKYKVAGDIDFWFKVLRAKPNVFYLNETFGFYRKEEAGASQSLKGVTKGFKEMLIVSNEYKQSNYGKMLLFIKYAKGFISVCKNNLIKKYNQN